MAPQGPPGSTSPATAGGGLPPRGFTPDRVAATAAAGFSLFLPLGAWNQRAASSALLPVTGAETMGAVLSQALDGSPWLAPFGLTERV